MSFSLDSRGYSHVFLEKYFIIRKRNYQLGKHGTAFADSVEWSVEQMRAENVNKSSTHPATHQKTCKYEPKRSKI